MNSTRRLQKNSQIFINFQEKWELVRFAHTYYFLYINMENHLSETITLRKALPVKPESVILSGKTLTVVPLDVERDYRQLYELSNGSEISVNEKVVKSYDPEELV